ncbi:hypothetical protein QOZ80_1AG0015980 [Eleusine coracana subsp. coracana]|nr:hypothetical protein QOZ80_1AG0015980 [Eleusine coracana subsp. coracana]
MAPPHAAEESSLEPESQDAYTRWLETLSEPELDLVISLKELAVTQAAHFDLSQRFHLRTLRALGTVLLQHFGDRLKQNSGRLELDRLALLRDPDVDAPTNRPEVPGSNKVQSMSNGVHKKRKRLQHGSDEESASNSKKRNMER